MRRTVPSDWATGSGGWVASTSMAGCCSNIVCWNRIHFARSPVSPSGRRLQHAPPPPLNRRNTSSLLSSGMLPTKWSRSRLELTVAPRSYRRLSSLRKEGHAKADDRPEKHVLDAGMLPSPLEAVHLRDRIGRDDEDRRGDQSADPAVEPGNQCEGRDQLQQRRQHDEERGGPQADLVEQLRRALDIAELCNRVRQQECAADDADGGLGVERNAGRQKRHLIYLLPSNELAASAR